MNDLQRQFLDRATAEAVKANHPFAQMAACEAALESSWGNSQLAREANNLFGMKQHVHPIYGTMSLPTREWQNGPDGHAIDGRWVTVTAKWTEYPDWRACFADRLVTLERLSNAYPHYKAALEAKDARSYIVAVSESWSTDPGWQCSCGQQFLSEADAYQHIQGNAGAPRSPGTLTRVPGLGRALKVLSIYNQLIQEKSNDPKT